MIYLGDCLTKDTPIFLTSGKEPMFKLCHKKSEKLYIKDFNPAEFVGEELCILKKIRCPHYFMVGVGARNYRSYFPYQSAKKMCCGLGIASKSFHRPGYKYKSVTDYGLSQYDEDIFEKMLEQANGEENRKQLCEEMLQLLALDIYMGQTDRFAFNYEFEEDKEHHVHLAPIFDFQYSLSPLFIKEDAICYGDLQPFQDFEECREFLKKYPKFGEYLKSYLGEDLASIVKSSYAKRRMIVPEKEISVCREFEKSQKEKIKRIVR